jgi:mannose/fructose/N-acetylgalactosamine-specific phosphotransferase system component IID
MSEKNSEKGIVRMFLYSLLLQAVINDKSMISVGFTFSLWAKCKFLFDNDEDRIAFLKRNLSFFNANPYMASYAIGAVAKLEEEHKKTGSPNLQSMEMLRNALIGPLGAIGDQVFWRALKPAVTLLGLLSLVLFEQLNVRLVILGMVLLVYNIPHFSIRYKGMRIGYEKGFDVYKYIKIDKFIKLINCFTISGAISLGVMLTVFFVKTNTGCLRESIFFALILISSYFIRKRISNIYLALLAPLILSMIVGIIMVEL